MTDVTEFYNTNSKLWIECTEIELELNSWSKDVHTQLTAYSYLNCEASTNIPNYINNYFFVLLKHLKIYFKYNINTV